MDHDLLALQLSKLGVILSTTDTLRTCFNSPDVDPVIPWIWDEDHGNPPPGAFKHAWIPSDLTMEACNKIPALVNEFVGITDFAIGPTTESENPLTPFIEHSLLQLSHVNYVSLNNANDLFFVFNNLNGLSDLKSIHVAGVELKEGYSDVGSASGIQDILMTACNEDVLTLLSMIPGVRRVFLADCPGIQCFDSILNIQTLEMLVVYNCRDFRSRIHAVRSRFPEVILYTDEETEE